MTARSTLTEPELQLADPLYAATPHCRGMSVQGQRTNPLTRESAARKMELVAVGTLTR